MDNMEQAQKEYEEVIKWVMAEEDKLEKELKENGKWTYGLDGNVEDFAYIRKEHKRRVKEIKKKYGMK